MKYFITIIICFVTLDIIAQKTNVTIDSYVQMHQTIDSLRKDFDVRIQLKEPGIIHTLNTQVILINKDTVQVFLPTERAIALYLVHDFQSLLKDIDEGTDYHYLSHAKKFKRIKIKFSRFISYQEITDLLKDLKQEKENIMLAVNQSVLNNDEKDFLKLYLTSILSYIDLKSFDTEQMNRDNEAFLEKYSNSKYAEYVKNVLYIQLKTMNFGIGGGLFSGYTIVKGNISTYFKNYIPIGANLELGYKRFLMKGEISPSFSRHLKKTFDYKNNTWARDSTPFIIDGNLNFGYALLNKSTYKLTPYVGIGTHGINLSNGVDNMLFHSNINLGMDIDWKFAYTKTYGSYYEAFNDAKDNTYWHLRFRIGYAQFKNDDDRFNGSMIYTRVEIGFYSNPAKRIKRK